jgi:hypothetical protein
MRSSRRSTSSPRRRTGADPEVDAVLDHTVLLFNVIQNPDGRVAGTRANGNGFDLNRDFMTQSQSEAQASVSVMQKWLPPEVLDLHGYVTPTLIEATMKPHNPSIDYDLWLKWNQPRIDANEAALGGAQLRRHPADQRLVLRRQPRPLQRDLPGWAATRTGRSRGLGRLGPVLRRCTHSTSASTARRSRCATRPTTTALFPADTGRLGPAGIADRPGDRGVVEPALRPREPERATVR